MFKRMILRYICIKRIRNLLINLKFNWFLNFLKICIIILSWYIGVRSWNLKIYIIVWVYYMICLIWIFILIKVRVEVWIYIINIMMKINIWSLVDGLTYGVCFYELIIISLRRILVDYPYLTICYRLINLFLV